MKRRSQLFNYFLVITFNFQFLQICLAERCRKYEMEFVAKESKYAENCFVTEGNQFSNAAAITCNHPSEITIECEGNVGTIIGRFVLTSYIRDQEYSSFMSKFEILFPFSILNEINTSEVEANFPIKLYFPYKQF